MTAIIMFATDFLFQCNQVEFLLRLILFRNELKIAFSRVCPFCFVDGFLEIKFLYSEVHIKQRSPTHLEPLGQW